MRLKLRIAVPLLTVWTLGYGGQVAAAATQTNSTRTSTGVTATPLDVARKQCQDNAYRSAIEATKANYAARTTCGTPEAELRYRIFLRLHGNLMRIKLQTLDAVLKTSDEVHDQVDKDATFIGNLSTLVASIDAAQTVNGISKQALNEEMFKAVKDLFVAGADFDPVVESQSARDKRLLDPLAKIRSSLDAMLSAPKAAEGDLKAAWTLGTYFLTTTIQTANDLYSYWKTNQVTNARLREVALFDSMYNFLKNCETDVSKFAIPSGTKNSDEFRARMSEGVTRVVRAATYQTKACEARIICGPGSNESLACTVANGSGTQTRTCSADGRAWNLGACGAIKCNSGFAQQGSACVQLTPPSLSTASLPASTTRNTRAFFSGTATDVRGLAGVSVVVSGPRGSNISAFNDANVSGTSKALSGYYFDGASPQYAGVPGSYTVTLLVRNIAGQSASRTFAVTIADGAPSLSAVALATSTTKTSRIYFAGEATDDTGLVAISMTVSGPRKSNVTAFTDTSLSGKVKSLSSYYFDPASTAYAGVAGVYSIVLRVQDRSSQASTKAFSVTVR